MNQTNAASREKRQKMMLEEPMLRVIPKIAVPMIVSTVIDSLYNLADTFFVSGLGQTAHEGVQGGVQVEDEAGRQLYIQTDGSG